MSHNAYDASDALDILWTDEGHPDEGSLLAYVHGAFDEAKAAEAHAHVAGCDVCQDEVALLRGYSAATSRILGALDRAPGHVVAPLASERPWTHGERSAGSASAPPTKAASAARAWARPQQLRVAAAVLLLLGGAMWSLRDPARTAQVALSRPGTGAAVADSSTVPRTSPPVTLPRARGVASGNETKRGASMANIATARKATSSKTRDDNNTKSAAVRSQGTVVPTTASREVVVRGTIRAVDTQSPIEAATVVVGKRMVSTDNAGRFTLTLSGVERGDSVRVLIRRLGYSATSVVSAIDGDTLTVDAALPLSVVSLQTVTVAANMPRTERVTVSFSTATVAASSATVAAPGSGERNENATLIRATAKQQRDAEGDREQYDRIEDNPFLSVKGNPRSTFSIDVDRASYGNVRRFINSGTTPPPDAVRIEELVNYFPYDLPAPRGDAPVAITTEAMAAPWQPQHRLVRIALQARRIETDALPPSNLVFLIDVSGSMQSPDKLPLVKASLRLLVDQLRPQDRVALVVYAGAAGLVLPSTSGADKATIAAAIDRLEAGGSTAGGAGIELAYQTAKANFLESGNNRVILATDGDFNVGPSSDAAMERLIESKRAEGTYLTILGFGTGNYQDAKMEKLAKHGNGNVAYVDDLAEARKVLVREMSGTLLTVANDVKLQVEFNPSKVKAYRLIGYEDRMLSTEDFDDDRKDAGDIGAGHSVTALYEVVPKDVKGTVPVRDQDALRYEIPQRDRGRPKVVKDELLYVSLRYKVPGDSSSTLIGQPVLDERNDNAIERPSTDLRFSASVAAFGMLLRDSEYKGSATFAGVLEMARSAQGADAGGYRREFVGLVEKLERCMSGSKPACVVPKRAR